MEAYRQRIKKCVVPDCQDIHSKRHTFPKKDADLFQKWVDNVNNPLLVNKSVEQIHKTYVVCDTHFSKDFKVPGTLRGLTKNAYPTVGLPLAVDKVSEASSSRKPADSTNSPHHFLRANTKEFLKRCIEDVYTNISNPTPAKVHRIADENDVKQEIKIESEDCDSDDEPLQDSLINIETLLNEIAHLRKKTEEQEQTICDMRALNESLAKDLHHERHQNLYLKNKVNLLEGEKVSERKKENNTVHRVGTQNSIVLVVTNDESEAVCKYEV